MKTDAPPRKSFLRRLALRILPSSLINRYRRRRATRRYLEALSWEVLERGTRLDYLEGRIAARRDGFYERIVTEVLERTEIILQELDRRIEGVAARSGQELAAVEEQLAALKQEMGRLRELREGASAEALGGPGHSSRDDVRETAAAESGAPSQE